MKFEKFLKMAVPLVAMTALSGMAGGGCGNVVLNGEKGVPLAELDMASKAPTKLMLMGSDTVRLTTGDTLSIELEGSEDDKARMRFVLDDETLGVLRDGGWNAGGGMVTVHVTMPAPREISVAGSGTVYADTLARDTEVSIGGSGTLEAPRVDVDRLDVSIGGSGDIRAAGTARELEISLAGSGNAKMPDLKADNVKVSIAGSGSATFASDGEVDADIIGSGNVTVRGSARCKVNSVGSGTVTCERGEPGDAAN